MNTTAPWARRSSQKSHISLESSTHGKSLNKTYTIDGNEENNSELWITLPNSEVAHKNSNNEKEEEMQAMRLEANKNKKETPVKKHNSYNDLDEFDDSIQQINGFRPGNYEFHISKVEKIQDEVYYSPIEIRRTETGATTRNMQNDAREWKYKCVIGLILRGFSEIGLIDKKTKETVSKFEHLYFYTLLHYR